MWSRTGQRQSSCLCRVCLHSAKSVARRSTTAAPRRRKVTATDLFTACYTTILGTAAMLDAQHKEFRKRDLDDKLEKTRAAVNSLAAQNAAALADSAAHATSANESSAFGPGLISQLAKPSLYQQCATIYGDQWKPFAPRYRQIDHVDWAGFEKAITAENHDSRVKLIEPTSSSELSIATDAVIHLVDELVAKVGQPEAHNSPTSDARERELWQELEEARRSAQFPSYEFPHIDPEGSAETRSDLRESLIMAMDPATPPREMVAKICYNLLVSSPPPSIMIYNTLIAGFNRLQRPDLAQSVVDTILQDTAGPVTQQTTLCLLKHFTSQHDSHGIRKVAKRMRGVVESCLHLNHLPEAPEDPVTFEGWAHDQEGPAETGPPIFVKLAPITRNSYETLIRAWLEVGNVDRAAKKFLECLRHDVETDIHTVHQLFQDCALGFESKVARKLVIGIAPHANKFVAMMQQLVMTARVDLATAVFENLHRLLEISWDTTVCDYGRSLDPYIRFNENLKAWALRYRIRLQARLTMHATEEVFRHLSLDLPLSDRIDAALHVLNQSSFSLDTIALWRRAAKLSTIDSHFENLQARSVMLNSQISSLIIKLRTGIDVDPAHHLESVRFKEKRRQLVLADALEQVAIRSTMTRDQVKNDLVARLPNPLQADAFMEVDLAAKISIGNLTRFYGPRQRQNALVYSQRRQQRREQYDPDSLVAELEAEVDQRLRLGKALLYRALNGRKHRGLRWAQDDWEQISLRRLVRLNRQRLRQIAELGGWAPKEEPEEPKVKGPPFLLSSTPRPLPPGIEISPMGQHIQRTWNPPKKPWAVVTNVSKAGPHTTFFGPPPKDPVGIAVGREWGKS